MIHRGRVVDRICTAFKTAGPQHIRTYIKAMFIVLNAPDVRRGHPSAVRSG